MHTRNCAAVLLLASACAACTTTARVNDWEPRLHGNAVVLLGELHDNAEQHRLRLAALESAFAAGWRPAIAMEQFDREHQADIERARREAPGDAQQVVEAAAPPSTRPGSGWNWDFYRPVVALALRYDVPLLAANVSNTDTTKIVRGGYPAVFDEASIARLGLDRPIPPDWQAAQEREIDAGHCNMLPPASWPRMARAQFARDAVMAEVLRENATHGVVLLAGNGHVRRDIGVPRWMGDAWQARIFAVGFLEQGHDSATAPLFDAVVVTAPAERPDPCAAFKPRQARP
jgi:uncharacterized iron-regulated protein